MPLMTLAEMGAWVAEHHRSDLLRIEAQPVYLAVSDGGDWERFRAGKRLEADISGWLNNLRESTAAGRIWRRVQIAEVPLDSRSYTAFSALRYVDTTAAGEQVRVLDTDPQQADLLAKVGDFFVAEGQKVLLTYYDQQGRHLGGEVADPVRAAVLRRYADSLWREAEDFTAWYARHPELHAQRSEVA